MSTPARASRVWVGGDSAAARDGGFDLSIWRQGKPSAAATVSGAWVDADGEDVGMVGLDVSIWAHEAMSLPAAASDAWVGRDSAADRVPGQKSHRRAEPGPGRFDQGGATHPFSLLICAAGGGVTERWRAAPLATSARQGDAGKRCRCSFRAAASGRRVNN